MRNTDKKIRGRCKSSAVWVTRIYYSLQFVFLLFIFYAHYCLLIYCMYLQTTYLSRLHSMQ